MRKNFSILCLLFTLWTIAQGNYTVTSLSDDGSAGTLRWAIANTTASTIDFDSGLTGTITLTSHLPNITRNITITGNGIDNLTLSGAGQYRMFQVSGGAVLNISNITFTNNCYYNGSIFRADNNNSSVVATSIKASGNFNNFAFYTNNPSTITISNSIISNNSGTMFGSDYGSTPTITSDVETDYTNRITVTGTTFSNNSGIIFSVERYVKIDNCIFNANTNQIGNFRGVNRFQVLNSTFTNNTGWSLFGFYSWISYSDWSGNLATLGTNHHLFDGNTFSGNTGTVISTGSPNEQSKTTISNNIFTNNGNGWTGTPAVVTANTQENFISSVTHSSVNSTITVVMNRPVFNSNTGSGDLEANDFQFSLSGGNATLVSSTPTSIAINGNTYVLGINLSGDIYGTETLRVNPISNSIFDSNSNIASSTQKNNTTTLTILDSDNDGVANYRDQCPTTLPGVVVEPTTGCDDVTPPNSPVDFTSVNRAYKIILNWTPNTDDTVGYMIYSGTNPTTLNLITTLNSIHYASYEDTNLPANTTFYYKIVAFDLAGNQSATSTIISGVASEPTIWDGPIITFTKTAGTDWTLPANQDYLTDNVIITRGNNQGLFNIAKESVYYSTSPTDTEWALGTTDNFSSLNFTNWSNAVWGCPPCSIGNDYVLHLITDDVYINIKILSWGVGGGASNSGFSYQRSTPKPKPTLTHFDPISKKYHDSPFNLITPTSDSTGLFTFESSNPTVATISGNTVTITGIGTTLITATQGADSTFSTNTISTTLTVEGVRVLTKNGAFSETDRNYIDKNGRLGGEIGLSKNGQIKTTISSSFTQKSVAFETYFDLELGVSCTSCEMNAPSNYDLKFAAGAPSIRSRMWWNEQYSNMAMVYDKTFDALSSADIHNYYYCDYVGDGNLACTNVDTPPINFVGIYQTNEGNYYAVQYLSEDEGTNTVTFKYKKLN
ncbi:hypothetical protein [Flavobacterium sp. UMI-01]|uniref:hypothetical protein n=1 Tax=Flavobacterium sp. UMI-01 TaxID=1441053 RepID=UPI001C7DE526|nr:hypothetical protein [Flavobacterium sp. UMI-01]GIZ09083.1 hypothetical protein FUMI01_18100 [Flavobacterium sp. UMI-01]